MWEREETKQEPTTQMNSTTFENRRSIPLLLLPRFLQ